MADSYDLTRYAKTQRSKDAEIETPMGPVSIKFFEIDEEFIDKDLQHQSADYVFFAAHEETFKTELANVQNELSRLKSQIWSDTLKTNPSLRIKDVEAIVEGHDDIIALKEKELSLDHAHRTLIAIRKAFDMKVKMIQSKIGYMRSKIEQNMASSRAEQSDRYRELIARSAK